MRNLKSYLSLILMGTLAFTGCQDDFDDPGLNTPESTWLADTDNFETVTIADIKTQYWQSGDNYYTTIGAADDGRHLLVKGHVISSDASGNIYKSMVIQDETGALAMSINANSMNVKYRRGQELVIDLTGMTIGKYSGLQQLGFPEESTQYGKQTTFMPYEVFQAHTQMNGLPDTEAINVIEVKGSQLIGGGDETLIKWQSQLVRFNNCYFEEGGKEPFGVSKENTNRILVLEDGTKINVRTSGYSNFYSDILPAGHGDVVGILGYYAGSSDTGNQWQLTLIDRNGCMNFGNPTVGPGAETNPYTVDDAIALLAGGGSASQVWTTGYIVGAVAPGVTDITANDNIQFGADVDLPITLVFASDPACKDYTKCMVINLPEGSNLRKYGNLVEHPENLGKQIWLKGNLGTVLGTYGITGNQGRSTEFRIEGVDVPADPEEPSDEGDGTENAPYNIAQVIALNPTSTTISPDGGSGVYVTGYIVGYMPTGGSSTTLAQTIFGAADATNLNIVLAPTPDCTVVAQCIGVQLPVAVRDALNLQTNPGNLGRKVTLFGDVMKYCGAAGLKNTSSYKFADGEGGGDTPTPPVTGDGDGSEAKPYSVDQTISLGNPGTTSWVKGYIVGWVEGAKISEGSHFSVPATSASNVLIATSPTETNYAKCIPVQLVAQTDIRAAVNLMDNPSNLGKELSIEGQLTAYFGQPGLKAPSAYKLSGSGDNPVPPTGGGDGTQTSPFSVSDIIAKGSSYTQTGAYVKGYIVGAIGDKSWTAETSEWAAPFTLATNIMLADSPNEKDWTKCIPVQLPAGDVRNALNLNANPGNLGKCVTLAGNVEKYFGKPGFKGVTSYKMDGGTSGGDTPTPPPSGMGTETNPFTPSAIIDKGASFTQKDSYLEGYIVGAISDKSWSAETSEWAAPFTLATNILVADNPSEKDWTKCVPVQLPAGDVRTALNLNANPGNLGKKVLLKGEVAKYFGKPGFKTVSSYTFK